MSLPWRASHLRSMEKHHIYNYFAIGTRLLHLANYKSTYLKEEFIGRKLLYWNNSKYLKRDRLKKIKSDFLGRNQKRPGTYTKHFLIVFRWSQKLAHTEDAVTVQLWLDYWIMIMEVFANLKDSTVLWRYGLFFLFRFRWKENKHLKLLHSLTLIQIKI